jgi:hypothetical protein
MIRRRTAEAGVKVKLGCHVATSSARPTSPPTYRPTGPSKRRPMAAHESPPTTKLYDRTVDEITLDEIERISI